MNDRRPALLTAVPLLLLGCSATYPQAVPLRPAQAYRFTAKDKGLEAGAEVYDTPKKATDALGKNVTETFTPVQAVIENTAQDKFVVRRAKAKLTCANGTTLEPVSAQTFYLAHRENALGLSLVGFRTWAAVAAEENDQMRHDWTEKEFPAESILMPGERVGGFLYFRGKCSTPADRSVTLTANGLASDEVATMVIELRRL